MNQVNKQKGFEGQREGETRTTISSLKVQPVPKSSKWLRTPLDSNTRNKERSRDVNYYLWRCRWNSLWRFTVGLWVYPLTVSGSCTLKIPFVHYRNCPYVKLSNCIVTSLPNKISVRYWVLVLEPLNLRRFPFDSNRGRSRRTFALDTGSSEASTWDFSFTEFHNIFYRHWTSTQPLLKRSCNNLI